MKTTSLLVFAARRPTAWMLSALALCLALAGPATAAPHDFQIIVHPDNPITSIDVGLLRNAYLKKTSDWSNGTTIRPIDLAPRFVARAYFVQRVLRKTMPQLRCYWSQRVFSGKGVPPHQVESTAAVIAYVLANPGAVGYLPAGADPGRAKVIELH